MFKQIELPYAFDALEPYIDALTMEVHYTKHHAAYTNNFNAAVEKLPALAGKSAEDILKNLGSVSDPALRTALQNNGGGYYNHNLYFGTLSPEGGGDPTGALRAQIEKDFGGVDALREKMNAAAMARFGSGWAWLAADAKGGLHAYSTANQDNPLMDGSRLTPILGIDVWEHAYYLKYKNLRGDYLKAFWEVVDWDAVALLYEAAGK